jgi:hypothetical protein
MGFGSRMYFRIMLSLLPALVLALAAFFLQAVDRDRERLAFMADQARLAASAVDLRMERLLNLTRFCATSPALIALWDPASLTENCGRYAAMLEAWVVVVTLDDMHRQILNTRPDPPAVLPS